MKRILLATLFALTGAAQAQTLASPESLEFHPRSGRLLIANTNSSQILARNTAGSLSVFTSVSSPYGIELLGGTLFVLSSGKVMGYDIDSAQQVMNLTIAGASFLNGITSNGVDTLYITDFSAKKLLKVNVADLANPVQTPLQTLTLTPNGVVFDAAANRLLIGTWSTARVLSYDIAANTAPTTLIQPTGYSNIDGIALDCEGRLHITAWSCPGGGGCLRRFDPPFTLTSTPISEGAALTAPADIDFGTRSGDLAIPETSANRITLVPTGCAASLFADDFER